MALSETAKPPRHIAIIMDGNGRWAKQRGLPRTAGHAAGAEAFRRIANYCRTLGVEYLTVYAFSTENWKRSAEEVAGIMKLLRRYLEEALRDMEKNRVRFCFFGDLTKLSPDLQALCDRAQRQSEHYDVQVNFCLNYGGRDEIVRAARRFAQDVADMSSLIAIGCPLEAAQILENTPENPFLTADRKAKYLAMLASYDANGHVET